MLLLLFPSISPWPNPGSAGTHAPLLAGVLQMNTWEQEAGVIMGVFKTHRVFKTLCIAQRDRSIPKAP